MLIANWHALNARPNDASARNRQRRPKHQCHEEQLTNDKRGDDHSDPARRCPQEGGPRLIGRPLYVLSTLTNAPNCAAVRAGRDRRSTTVATTE